MTPTQALQLLRDFMYSRIAVDRVKELNDAYEILRKLVVDDIARKKNAEIIEEIRNKEP